MQNIQSFIQDYTPIQSLTNNVLYAGKYQNWDQNPETRVWWYWALNQQLLSEWVKFVLNT